MSSRIDIDYALAMAVETARKAGKTLRKLQGSNLKVKRKIRYDIVSDADLFAEREITYNLKKHFPDHYFISEELKVDQEDTHRFKWIIDPLDGTINYVSGLPFFSSSIALQEEGKTILGVIYDVMSGELYTSIKGRGSFIDGRKLQVSDNSDVGNSVLSFMLTSHYNGEEVDETLKHVNKLARVCRGLRLYVSQALELAYIARGKMDGTLCIKSRGFSAAAGALILREAGGRVTDLNGREFDNSSRSLLATNSSAHDKILDLIRRNLKEQKTRVCS